MDKNFAQRRGRELMGAAALAAIAALVPLFVKDVYVQNIMVLTLMYAALSQSWNILSGYCGQISLGHALYFGLGAYTTAILFTKFGVLPWFGMLGGGAISAVIAMALGLAPTLIFLRALLVAVLIGVTPHSSAMHAPHFGLAT